MSQASAKREARDRALAGASKYSSRNHYFLVLMKRFPRQLISTHKSKTDLPDRKQE